jgi:hypothetical protein
MARLSSSGISSQERLDEGDSPFEPLHLPLEAPREAPPRLRHPPDEHDEHDEGGAAGGVIVIDLV